MARTNNGPGTNGHRVDLRERFVAGTDLDLADGDDDFEDDDCDDYAPPGPIAPGSCVLEREEWVTLDRDYAECFSRYPMLAGERPLSPGGVNAILAALKGLAGDLVPERVFLVTVYCEANGWLGRVDGKHTVYAYLRYWEELAAQGMTPRTLRVRRHHYRVATMRDAEELAGRLDSNKSRTGAQKAEVLMASVPPLDRLTRKYRNRLYQGYRRWQDPTQAARAARSVEVAVADLLGRDWEATRRTAELAYRCCLEMPAEHGLVALTEARMARGPVFAALYATSAAAPEAATEFWGPVVLGEYMSAADPRVRLREWLGATTLASKDGERRVKVDPELMYYNCIHCWNLWRCGKLVVKGTKKVLRQKLKAGDPRIRPV